MKILSILNVACILIIGCAGTRDSCGVDDDFFGDLSSEDNRIAGELYLDAFRESLDSLSFEYYLGYVAGHEAPSAKGLARKIRCADQYFFDAGQEGFVLLLRYDGAGIIVGDNSETAFVDTIISLDSELTPKKLSEIAKALKRE
jgi:hypothetical protein